MKSLDWKGNGGGPKITLAEFASSKGLTIFNMVRRMHPGTNPPKPCVFGGNGRTGKKAYYKPKELNDWWNKLEGMP